LQWYCKRIDYEAREDREAKVLDTFAREFCGATVGGATPGEWPSQQPSSPARLTRAHRTCRWRLDPEPKYLPPLERSNGLASQAFNEVPPPTLRMMQKPRGVTIPEEPVAAPKLSLASSATAQHVSADCAGSSSPSPGTVMYGSRETADLMTQLFEERQKTKGLEEEIKKLKDVTIKLNKSYTKVKQKLGEKKRIIKELQGTQQNHDNRGHEESRPAKRSRPDPGAPRGERYNQTEPLPPGTTYRGRQMKRLRSESRGQGSPPAPPHRSRSRKKQRRSSKSEHESIGRTLGRSG